MTARAAGRIVAGAEYVEQITARDSDRRARTAFQELVSRIAPPAGAIFDFGCGPGIDARLYAERGFTVFAYDVDPRMCDYFAGHCRAGIDAGRISLERGSYREFLARREPQGMDLIVANFAPFNLVQDLRELFAKFHALAAPQGKVLASVLSPYFAGDLRYAWWWRNCVRLWHDGHYRVPGAQSPIVRRRLADFAAQSTPHFALRRVFPGRPSSGQRMPGVDVSCGLRRAWLRAIGCRFMFLLFERI